ncbi:hypothetical protein QP414_09385 [Corynebacterium simulans]|uniref:hypothetical protein n=1 Tax=Corynebacterium TaxID=1716 RepID=UPI0008A106B5|nr:MULTISPECIES: hypothetical protein [Corynebacterium]MCG7247672.1 hypothetical protein [Corynebacterium simulans]MDK7139515.1 hypothetical protein [Corynebacterium simulans]OFM02835.1 hypothetical protein HMPREF2724_04855 [Corynebacterium sp. HMSC071F07]OFQ46399.1 hypothetical protein HMPREF2935_02450 [Corynebacterium sp. HMSC076D02]OFR37304.1 hypothetical protein HMPREF2888_02365 [Corynebacterium sp. HMSC077D03]
MYSPIPGFSHLKLYTAPDRVRYERKPTEEDLSARKEILDLVVFALEVTGGLRPLHHLAGNKYNRDIKVHLRAWALNHRPHDRPLRAQLRSLHARANGEFFGSADIGGKRHGFTGSFKHNRLEEFRLLSLGHNLNI